MAIAIEHMGEVDASGVLSSGLPLDEPGDRNSYFTGVLLGYHGNVIRTEPCILEYEAGMGLASLPYFLISIEKFRAGTK